MRWRAKLAQVFLYETRAQVHIDLDQRRVTDALEAVHFPGLDDEDVPRAGFELFTVYGPETAALSHELNFVVRVTVGPGTTTGLSVEEKHGHVDVAVVGADELVRAANERQVLLANAVHPPMPARNPDR